MNRRNFVKNLLGSVALVAAVKVGLGNVTTEDALSTPPKIDQMLFDICDSGGNVLQTVEGRLNPRGHGIIVAMPLSGVPSDAFIVPRGLRWHDITPVG